MSRPNLKSALTIALGILVAMATLQVQTARAAERVVGQVTGSDVVRKTIDIDGVTYEVSPEALGRPSGRIAGARKLSDIRRGQSVIYEADGGVIRSMTFIDGAVPQ
jgi:hypothetical protein